LATALAIVAAISAQLQYLADNDLLRVVNFFSFFTIQSNVLAVATLIGLEVSAGTAPGAVARWMRGGVTLFMTMTGLIYAVLLAPVAADVSTQLDWVNAVLHVIAPLVLVGDWIIEPDRPAPDPVRALWWLAFPVAWLTYTFVRGAIVDWYPYPFMDPRDGVPHAAGSWPAVIVTTAILSVLVAGLAQALAWLARRRDRAAERASVNPTR
jgi:hypothetical protein